MKLKKFKSLILQNITSILVKQYKSIDRSNSCENNHFQNLYFDRFESLNFQHNCYNYNYFANFLDVILKNSTICNYMVLEVYFLHRGEVI